MANDRLIVLTQEKVLPHEAALLVQLLDTGIHKIHIRKPSWSTYELVALLKEVPQTYRKHLIVHRDIEAAVSGGAGGVHLPFHDLICGKISLPADFALSASVHSWEEAETAMKLCKYSFISPVYNSISKTGYQRNPDLMQVPVHLNQKRIYALGGISPDNCQEVLGNGYHGVAALGYVWADSGDTIKCARQLLEALSLKESSL